MATREHEIFIDAINAVTMMTVLGDDDWDDWRWGGNARTQGASDAAFANLLASGISCWQFINGKELFFSDLQLPHDYAEGTSLIPHIHFCATSAGRITGTWTLEMIGWKSGANGEPITVKQTTTASFDVNPPVAGMLISQEFVDVISGAGRKISCLMHARLSLALTSGAALALCGLDAHYQKDRAGSRKIKTKE